MRKLFTFILSTLCLTIAISQNVTKTFRELTRQGLADTFRLKKQNISTYDKKNCVDTLFTQLTESERLGSNSKIVQQLRTVNQKFDTQKRLIEDIINTDFFEERTPNSFVFDKTDNRRERRKLIYTASNIKMDTIIKEKYDTLTKTWVLVGKSSIRKPGFGLDTVKVGTTTSVFDNYGNQILDWKRDAKGITTDSIVTAYDNLNRFISIEYYFINNLNKLALTYSFKVTYLNEKLMKETSYGASQNDTLKEVKNFIYNGDGVLASDEFESLQILVKSGSSTTKKRNRYTKYNTFKRCLEKESESWNATTNTWILTSRNKMTYYKDTLLSRDTLFAITNNVLTGYDKVSAYDYEECGTTISATNDINKGIDFTLAPNPTTGLFNLSLSQEALQSGASVSVYNIQGGEVFRTKLTSESTAVDLSNLSKGFYLVKVADKAHSSVKKLVLN
jgi:Secretion system C-terminal sorting domain